VRAIGAALRRYATGVEAASGGLVVATTPSGHASALAQAIDEGSHPSIAGTSPATTPSSSPHATDRRRRLQAEPPRT
jgi:hypothetical protein